MSRESKSTDNVSGGWDNVTKNPNGGYQVRLNNPMTFPIPKMSGYSTSEEDKRKDSVQIAIDPDTAGGKDLMNFLKGLDDHMNEFMENDSTSELLKKAEKFTYKPLKRSGKISGRRVRKCDFCDVDHVSDIHYDDVFAAIREMTSYVDTDLFAYGILLGCDTCMAGCSYVRCHSNCTQCVTCAPSEMIEMEKNGYSIEKCGECEHYYRSLTGSGCICAPH